MSGIVALVGVMVFGFLFTAAAFAWEKRLIWAYVPESEMPAGSVPPPNAYSNTAASAAASAGFAHWGTFGDGKGKLYRIRYDFYRSPSGDTLAVVGAGTLAGVPTQTTWLNTLLSDGRCLMTVDNPNGDEVDLAGITEGAVFAGVGFDRLLQFHRDRIAGAQCPLEFFGEVDPLVAFQNHKQRRIDLLMTQGNAAFLGPEKVFWRYTLKGAIVLSLWQNFKGLRRSVVPDKAKPAAGRRP